MLLQGAAGGQDSELRALLEGAVARWRPSAAQHGAAALPGVLEWVSLVRSLTLSGVYAGII